MLRTAGFEEVYSMEGGIHAWEGVTATGAPEAGMAWFPEKASGPELVSLAWVLENGSRRFYSELPSRLKDRDAAALFEQLVLAEEHHQSSLTALYRKMTNSTDVPSARADEDVMEGGVKISEALAWMTGRSLFEVLQLAVGLETNSYDLYIKMGRTIKDERSREVFSMLASGEKDHLDRLVSLLEKHV